MKARYLLLGLAISVVAVVGLLRLRRDPLGELFGEALPAWQIARTRPEGVARAEPARRMEKLAARRMPELVPLLALLDIDWPDDAKVRADASEVNAALRRRGVPYFLDVQAIRDQPIVLTYEREAIVPWRLEGGEARAVDVIRIRRLDRINIEMGLYGETERSQPLVYLDRVEARLASELPAAFATRPEQDEVERAVLAQVRRVLEGEAGAAPLGEAAAKLGERDRLFEAMRTRLHGEATVVVHPDRFLFGDDWADEMAPYARFSRPGGPLVLDTDLRAVTRADAALADARLQAPLQAAVLLFAGVVEAHEARHALDVEGVAPPPAELLDLLHGGDPRFATLANGELRAYLGEIHDGPAPACLSLAETIRGVYGRHAGRTPHFFARRVLLARFLAADGATPAGELTAPQLLEKLCARPDADLRRFAAETWARLYGTPLVAATRGPRR